MAVPRLHINEILYLLVYTDDWGVVLFVRGILGGRISSYVNVLTTV
jgi:hypothetical protein